MPRPHQKESLKLGTGPKSTVHVFKYLLGRTFTAEGGSESDVKNQVEAAWAKRRDVSGGWSDKKMISPSNIMCTQP